MNKKVRFVLNIKIDFGDDKSEGVISIEADVLYNNKVPIMGSIENVKVEGLTYYDVMHILPIIGYLKFIMENDLGKIFNEVFDKK